MELIDRLSFNNCWACTHHATGKCDTWCDHGEAFNMRDDVAKAEVINVVSVANDKWISIKADKKPKHLQLCLIAYVFGEDESSHHYFGVERWNAFEGNGLVDRPHFNNEGVDDMMVTHWMEIPTIPELKIGKEKRRKDEIS